MATNEDFDEKASANNTDLSTELTKEFVPINTSAANFGPATKLPSRSSRLSRARSNNGYGCDDGHDSEASLDEGEGAVEKDPFEVQWDGGESDPMNPRSMNYGRKWVIVLVVSASSLCV